MDNNKTIGIDSAFKWVKQDKIKSLLADFSGLIFVALCLLLTNIPNIVTDNAAVESIINEPLSNTLVHSNQQYLKQIEQEAIDDFLLLTEISVFLDLVQSSQVGVSFIAEFKVTVGNAISGLNHGIKRAQEITLASAAATKIIQLISQIADYISPTLLQLSLWVWLLYFILDVFKTSGEVPLSMRLGIKHIATSLSICFLVMHLILPYSIHLSAVTSKILHADLKADNRSKLSNLHDHFIQEPPTRKLKDKAKNNIHYLNKLSTKKIHHKTESLLDYLLVAFSLWVFNLVIMPLVVLYFLYRLIPQLIFTKEYRE